MPCLSDTSAWYAVQQDLCLLTAGECAGKVAPKVTLCTGCSSRYCTACCSDSLVSVPSGAGLPASPEPAHVRRIAPPGMAACAAGPSKRQTGVKRVDAVGSPSEYGTSHCRTIKRCTPQTRRPRRSKCHCLWPPPPAFHQAPTPQTAGPQHHCGPGPAALGGRPRQRGPTAACVAPCASACMLSRTPTNEEPDNLVFSGRNRLVHAPI